MEKWKKLKLVVRDEIKICKKHKARANRENRLEEYVEYRAYLSTYNFILAAMDELDG